ncbi:MAG TPA: universal stress protein [Acidimicrobiales bacterium]|nr:universal stress protein [Acidimicrobiales bacterium]
MEATRIVVGVDGSATSQVALRWAVGLGDVLGAEVVAIHAVGLLDRWHDPDASARSWRRTLCDLVERTWCVPLARSPGCHRVEVRDGDPVDVLLAAAEDEPADLLVVGSRGVGDRPELALGSTSLRVLQAARVPVLVVPALRPGAASADWLRLHHLLVGVDRSDASRAALELAADVAAALGGSLSVLEVVDYVPPFPLGEAITAASGDEGPAASEAMVLLEAEVRDVRARGIGVQVIVRSGEPGPTLLEVADDMDADLVVVGTRGCGGAAELLLGSVARTVADRARRPTLVVPAKAGTVHLRRRAGGRHECRSPSSRP